MSAHDLTPDEIRTTADLLAMTEQAERGRLCERCRAVGKILRNALRVKIEEQDEVIAFLFYLRHADDVDYQSTISRRLQDKDRSHWLSPDEFERELDKKDTR